MPTCQAHLKYSVKNNYVEQFLLMCQFYPHLIQSIHSDANGNALYLIRDVPLNGETAISNLNWCSKQIFIIREVNGNLGKYNV